jgi:uncharacterized protein (DUF1684 family)
VILEQGLFREAGMKGKAKILLICFLAVVLPLTAETSAAGKTKPQSAQSTQSFDKWEAELIDDLKTNWLPLAGLYWLSPGDSSFGSAADNKVVFPKGPAHAGVFTLQGGEVTVKLASDVSATIDGKAVNTSLMQPDTSGKRTVVELGSLRFHVIKRGERIGIRLKDLDSDAVKNYHGPVFFPAKAEYRVVATWIPSDGKKTVDVPNVLGDVTPTPVAGTAEFIINNQKFQLTSLGGSAEKGLFFVFNDLTTKTDTYPGGRFLDTEPVVKGKVVLDFNRAYNPPCSVTPYATCPLAPRENRLTVAIPAGEKYDRKHGHH